MRLSVALALLLVPAPAAAQIPAAGASGVPGWPAPAPAWHPAIGYVTAGQDEPGYRRWLAGNPWRTSHVAQFHNYLDRAGVAYVIPTWQLLRTASQWQPCGAEPFSMPPPSEWPNVVQTLRYLRDHVVPLIGPVEAVSAYRNPMLNRCAGGAANSVHQHLSAIDLVPLQPISRDALMRRLCSVHAQAGPRYSVGLGFYTKVRFHVDSWKFRTWGRNDHGGLACPRSYELAHRQLTSRPPAAAEGSLAPVTVSTATAAATAAPPAGGPEPSTVIAVDPLAPQK